MLAAPEGFCASLAETALPPVTHYRAECDATRHVMIPPGDILLAECENRFRLTVFADGRAVFTGSA